MDIESLHRRKVEQLTAQLQQQWLREQLGISHTGSAWNKRAALRCGLLLLRLARRLIRYGKPPIAAESQLPLLPRTH